jgi:prepilin-type N-terminal cleavage/methylation domain-containing protein
LCQKAYAKQKYVLNYKHNGENKMKIPRIKKPSFKDGFTIIEVVLVLAIAGLIFLMVFIALPALQRSQRDTQRRDDVSRAMTALTQYMANNRNRVPSEASLIAHDPPPSGQWGSCDPDAPSGFCGQYLLVGGDSFEDPDGEIYVFRSSDEAPDAAGGDPEAPDPAGPAAARNNGWKPTMEFDDPDFAHTIWVTYTAKCNGEVTAPASGNRKVAMQYKLEGGGIVCVNN